MEDKTKVGSKISIKVKGGVAKPRENKEENKEKNKNKAGE